MIQPISNNFIFPKKNRNRCHRNEAPNQLLKAETKNPHQQWVFHFHLRNLPDQNPFKSRKKLALCLERICTDFNSDSSPHHTTPSHLSAACDQIPITNLFSFAERPNEMHPNVCFALSWVHTPQIQHHPNYSASQWWKRTAKRNWIIDAGK